MSRNMRILILLLLLAGVCAVVCIWTFKSKDAAPAGTAGTPSANEPVTMEADVEVITTAASDENTSYDDEPISADEVKDSEDEETEAEHGIIEDQGEIEILVPEGEDTFGE